MRTELERTVADGRKDSTAKARFDLVLHMRNGTPGFALDVTRTANAMETRLKEKNHKYEPEIRLSNKEVLNFKALVIDAGGLFYRNLNDVVQAVRAHAEAESVPKARRPSEDDFKEVILRASVRCLSRKRLAGPRVALC